jgi:F-type H+-transporting ATPase subunit c
MMALSIILASKCLGAGLATISLAGAGVGIGFVFGSLLISMALNPNDKDGLFSYAILGFALTEAIALFGLMMAFLLLFAI